MNARGTDGNKKEVAMGGNPEGIERRSLIKAGLAGLAGVALGASCGRTPEPVTHSLEPAPAPPAKGPVMTRTLGRTGLNVSIVGMGVMNADNPRLVEAALAAGINHVDTAHGYQNGRNEEMVGQALKTVKRDAVVLATKVPPPGEGDATRRKARYLDMLEISLRRLATDYVDILYLHNLSSRAGVFDEAMLEVAAGIKQTGKARFIGVSTHSNEPEVIRAAKDSGVFDVVLTAYNFRQDHREEVRKAIVEAAGAGLGIVAMKTQAGVYWDRERLLPINMTAALKWVLREPSVHTSIPGFTTFDQLETDLKVMAGLELTPAERLDLDEQPGMAGLYCQQCGQCRPQCPAALPIPDLMRSYMYAYGYRNPGLAHDVLAELDLPGDPCAGCATCDIRCAKGFPVRERVRDIARLRNAPRDLLG
ncbi:MAG TPA: aldo/keto reductase [Acidobacteriota bacterium]|nr:aldo/keto reductase [Acidobacteriota bacterium]